MSRKIILASKSPFRKKMLEELGIEFEVVVSNADETPDESLSFGEQLKAISLKKAKAVFEKTISQGKRVIVAADQNIVFGGKMYGKPSTIQEARDLIKSMRGSDEIYAYVGNTIVEADGDQIIQIISNFETARMSMDNVSDEIIEDYLINDTPLQRCGGIHVDNVEFLHLLEGKLSTARGMTTEYLEEILES